MNAYAGAKNTIQGLMTRLESIETGAGGQAIGLETARFEHRALIELDAQPCATLRLNRPQRAFCGQLHLAALRRLQESTGLKFEGA